MFSKKKKSSRPEGGKGKKSDLGNMLGVGLDSEDFVGIGGMEDDDDDDDDGSLEAELAALQGGGQVRQRKRKPKLMGIDAIEKMAADQLNDDDDDDDVDDEDLENDAELMAELQCLAPGEDEQALKDPTPSLLPSTVQLSNKSEDSGHSSSELGELLARESMYRTAIENAQQAGDGSKARRFGRGLKQVESMIKQAKAGKPVDLSEMPPPVSVGVTPAPAPVPSEPPSVETSLIDLGSGPAKRNEPEQTEEDNRKAVQEVKLEAKDNAKEKKLEVIKARRDQYKVAALTCKRAGDIPQAKSFLAVSKRIDSMIEEVEGGEPVDLSQLPEAPSLPKAEPSSVSDLNQASTAPTEQPKPSAESAPQPAGTSSAPKNNEPPPPPRDVLEALTQRLEKYQSAAEQSKQEGNSGKARRMGRIVKQYQDAIKNHKAGKPVDYEELPTPPGFAPIPGQAADNTAQPQLAETQKAASTQAARAVAAPAGAQSSPTPAQPRLQVQPQGSKKSPSRNTQQLNFLLERQREFKMAALKAKKQGDIEEAKNYLRMAKGLDPMIEAAQNGIRVDLSTVPDSPGMTASSPAPTAGSDSAEIQIEEFRSVPRSPEEVAELFSRLEDALIKQMEMCSKNAQHFQKLGDIPSAKNFEKMAKNMRHDLDSVQSARKHKDLPPKFHYENRSFSIVHSYPELSDSELQIEVVRCLNIPLPSGYQPKDMYTYVTYDFPYPSAEEPQSGKTATVKNSINPEYREVFKVNIDRKNRSLARIFKRQALKFEVKYERGFLKGDKTLAQAQIKLAPLDTKCEIHECVDLMDTDRGRRAVGGKIEVQIRLRDPLSEKDVYIDKWKWLVIDLHLSSKKAVPEIHDMKGSPKAGKSTTASLDDLVSVEVLKMEKQIIEKQIAAQRNKGQMTSPSLMLRCKQCQQKIEEVEKMLSRGEKSALINYAREIAAKVPKEQAKAQRAVAAGDKAEAQFCLARKKLMQNELASLKPKLGLK